jgi:hypothetical protein
VGAQQPPSQQRRNPMNSRQQFCGGLFIQSFKSPDSVRISALLRIQSHVVFVYDIMLSIRTD